MECYGKFQLLCQVKPLDLLQEYDKFTQVCVK